MMTVETLDHPTQTDRDDVTSRELARTLAAFDLEALRAHHHGLAIAVAGLAAAAGHNWPWGHDDPTVALLRALAKLSIDAPDASSEFATSLHRTLTNST